MINYSTRIHIRVRSTRDWKLLRGINRVGKDFGNNVGTDLFGGTVSRNLVLESLKLNEDELIDFISDIVVRLKNSVLIVAETHRIGDESNTYLVYYFGEYIMSDYISGDIAEKLIENNINNLTQFFKIIFKEFGDSNEELSYITDILRE